MHLSFSWDEVSDRSHPFFHWEPVPWKHPNFPEYEIALRDSRLYRTHFCSDSVGISGVQAMEDINKLEIKDPGLFFSIILHNTNYAKFLICLPANNLSGKTMASTGVVSS
jgi:hypothetical protein